MFAFSVTEYCAKFRLTLKRQRSTKERENFHDVQILFFSLVYEIIILPLTFAREDANN